jgi:integrase
MRLTKRSIDAIKPDAKRDQFFWDDDVAGFGLRVKPSGARSFIVQYRNRHGRSRRLTLGRYGVLTPDQARIAAKLALADVARGGDPVETKAAERGAMSMADLCREYQEKAESGELITRRGKGKKPSTIYTDRGRIERHIIPLLGRRTVKEVTSTDINKFLADVISGKTKANVKTKARGRAIVKGGRGAGSRTLGLLGGIFGYAITQGYRSDNPCAGVTRPADKKRKYRLDEEGYKTLGDCLLEAEKKGEPWQAISEIRGLALTGCRRGEMENLKRVEVDQRGGALRFGDSKTGESIRPAGAAAFEVLRSALAKTNDEFVYPSPSSPDRPYRGLPKAFRRIVGDSLPGLTPHKLRHAFSSTAEDLGLTVPTIAALLGHALGGVTEGYIHKVDAALIAAANRVSTYIARAMAGRASNVVPLKKRRA